MIQKKDAEKSTGKTDIKLRFPCELCVRYLLPVVRALLAHELVKSFEVSQVKTAEILDVTQPAVSIYLNSDISLKRPELEGYLEEIKAVVRELADAIYQNKVTQIEAMMRICSLCIWLRTGGPLCRIHEDIAPALRMKTCSLCLRDLAAEKRKSLEEYEILDNVKRAVKLIEDNSEFSNLIPEIGTNIVMAKADAKATKDVVGVQGRIHIVGGNPRATGSPEFGGASHIANAILTIMKFDRSVRAAINMKFDWMIVKICEELGFRISFYDRNEEPFEIKSVDGRTIPWGMAKAVERIGMVPDVVYDLGDIGKEPMLFLFGSTAVDVAYLAVRIAGEYCRRKTDKTRQ